MGSRAATMRQSKPLGCIFSSLFSSCLGNVFPCVFCCRSFTVTYFCGCVHMKALQIYHFAVCFEVIFLKLNCIFTFTMMASIEISSSLLYLVFGFYRYLLLYLFYVGSLLDVFYVFFFSLVTRILVFFLSYFIFLVTSI